MSCNKNAFLKTNQAAKECKKKKAADSCESEKETGCYGYEGYGR